MSDAEDDTASSTYDEAYDNEDESNAEDTALLEQLLSEITATEAEKINPSTCEAEEMEELDGNWWPSDEQERGVWEGNCETPKPADWKAVQGTVQISVDRARRESWKQCQKEINMVRANVDKWIEEVLHTDNRDLVAGKSKDAAIFELLLGPSSAMGTEIKAAASIGYVVYCKWFYMFCLSCQTNQSAPQLHKNADIAKDMLLPTKEYNKIWRKLSNAGEIDHGGSATRQDPLWKRIERIFNEQARKLFMSDDPNFYYVISIDDDKVHFEWKKFTNTKGLKRCRHTKANARGFVVHTAGLPACGGLVQIGWAQEGDTETSVYQRITGGLFGATGGVNNRPTLQNVEFLFDRGYWSIDLLFNYMLPSGATVGGTLKRNGWIPYTYDMANSALPRKPENLSKRGYKNAYFKQLTLKMPSGGTRKIQVVAYRSGTGTSMSIVMNTKTFGKVWDMQTLNAKDLIWYHNAALTQAERNQKAFKISQPMDTPMSEEEHAGLVAELCSVVDARTCGQTSAEWFLERMFALTSSQIAALLRLVAKDVGPSHQSRQDFEIVFTYAGIKNVLPDADPIETNHSSDDDDDQESNSLDSEDGDDFRGDPVGNDDDVAKEWIARFQKSDPTSRCVENFCKDRIQVEGELSIGIVKAMLEQINCKPVQSNVKNRERLIKWFKAEASMRPFLNMKKKELTDHPLFAHVTCEKSAPVDDIRAALSEVQANVLQGDSLPTLDDSADGTVLQSFLRKSFMKAQKQQEKKDARLIGQMNEPLLLQQIWNQSKSTDWNLDLSLRSILEPGLVRQKERHFLGKAVVQGNRRSINKPTYRPQP